MKKLSIFLTTSLFALNINTYFFSIKENYKEYVNNINIDRDYNSFFDLSGVGIKIKHNFFKASVEYANGNATYDGVTQNGKKLKVKENNVYIFNAFFSIGKVLYFDAGYRLWNRGKSAYEGDYREKYYWPYIGASLDYNFKFNKFSFEPLISYQYAINPKLKIFIGNNPTLDLGNTKGYKIELPIFYKVNNIKFFLFYRYQYWNINHSKIYILLLNNKYYPIFEPESKTRNQYLGIGLNFNF